MSVKKQHYVIIDTNVLVSVFITKNTESPTFKILRFLAESIIIPIYSNEIIREYKEVLRRPKFKLSNEIVDSIIKDITDHGKEITNIPIVEEDFIDTKDIVFYAVTLSVQKEEAILVTGNKKHFPMRHYIVDPAKLVEIIEKED